MFDRTNSHSKYQALIPDEEQSNTETLDITNRTSRTRLILILCTTITILTTLVAFTLSPAFWQTQSLNNPTESNPPSSTLSAYPNIHNPAVRELFRQPTLSDPSTPSPCGNTSASARAANCIFAASAWSWSPPACYDWGLEAEFLALKDWQWFSTPTLEPGSELNRAAVLRGEYEVAYMEKEYHPWHCRYSMKKAFRAMLGFALADNYVLRLGHWEHCEGLLRTEVGALPVTKGVVRFLECVVV